MVRSAHEIMRMDAASAIRACGPLAHGNNVKYLTKGITKWSGWNERPGRSVY
jgi:hypothetical protein